MIGRAWRIKGMVNLRRSLKPWEGMVQLEVLPTMNGMRVCFLAIGWRAAEEGYPGCSGDGVQSWLGETDHVCSSLWLLFLLLQYLQPHRVIMQLINSFIVSYPTYESRDIACPTQVHIPRVQNVKSFRKHQVKLNTWRALFILHLNRQVLKLIKKWWIKLDDEEEYYLSKKHCLFLFQEKLKWQLLIVD